MLKTTVSRLFLGGALAVITGAILVIASVWIAIANDVFVMRGSDIVGLNASPLAWSLLVIGVAGSLAVIAGFVVGFVSWVGALLNTSRLERKAWFFGLLLLGIFNLGVFAMIAYVLAGPDGETGSSPEGSRATVASPACSPSDTGTSAGFEPALFSTVPSMPDARSGPRTTPRTRGASRSSPVVARSGGAAPRPRTRRTPRRRRTSRS